MSVCLRSQCVCPYACVQLCACSSGDNLLTAVSVARECGMIPPEAAAVVVTAHPPSSERPAYLEYTTAAADVAPVHAAGDEVSRAASSVLAECPANRHAK